MRTLRVSDITMKQKKAASLTFKEKLELVKLLDKLYVDVIELAPLSGSRADSLCTKSIAQTVKNATVAVECGPDKEQIDRAWESLKEAVRPRLQIVCPISSVQMEYLYHLKPAAMQAKVEEAVAYCRSLTEDVEFIADDATRSDDTYLYGIMDAAINAGASKVTVSDDAGNMLPGEYEEFIAKVFDRTEGLKNGKAELGVYCCNKLSMADILSITGAVQGAAEIKASVYPEGAASIPHITKIIGVKGDVFGMETKLHTVEMKSIVEKISRIFTETKSKNSILDDGVRDDRVDNTFTVHDGIDVITAEVTRLGYDLNEEDNKIVYDTFVRIASKKDKVSSKEIEAIIASSALQVPPTYRVEDFIINSGNIISATCHMRLYKNDKLLESVSIGDGPVDASFLAIEQITGHHYELDDFQIQSVTEGRTAMGETIVKLRAGGKLYSGRGISTDVIGSSILAYINALNKIVYEEENS